MKKIKCSVHGKVLWKNHIICMECERVYNEEEQDRIWENRKNICHCGKTLLPEKEKEFSARGICPKCYRKRRNQNGLDAKKTEM